MDKWIRIESVQVNHFPGVQVWFSLTTHHNPPSQLCLICNHHRDIAQRNKVFNNHAHLSPKLSFLVLRSQESKVFFFAPFFFSYLSTRTLKKVGAAPARTLS